MKKNVKLYNVMFPIWFFFLWPTYLWLIILPVNFIVDSVVLLLAARLHNCGNRIALWKKSILKVWFIGFLGDIAGAGLIFLLALLMGEIAPGLDIYHFPGTSIFALPGVFVAGALIYILNKRFSFTKTELDAEKIKKICLLIAVITAPYTMMIPLYG